MRLDNMIKKEIDENLKLKQRTFEEWLMKTNLNILYNFNYSHQLVHI